jgi:hypothetical protein
VQVAVAPQPARRALEHLAAAEAAVLVSTGAAGLGGVRLVGLHERHGLFLAFGGHALLEEEVADPEHLAVALKPAVLAIFDVLTFKAF